MTDQITPRKSSFFDHVEELKQCVVYSVLSILVCSILFSFFSNNILSLVVSPVGSVVFTAPAEAFMAQLILTVFGGIVFSSPIWGFQIWSFVAVGLNEKEQKYVKLFAPFSIFLFLAGVFFAFYFIIPFAFRFLLGFAAENVQPMITIRNYISFVTTLLLAFGVMFELPLVMLFLAKIGIATTEFLKQKRKVAIVVFVILSAFITPPDVVTQVLMAIPLILLYELGIVLSGWVERKKI